MSKEDWFHGFSNNLWAMLSKALQKDFNLDLTKLLQK
jgi:hypothetical protein